MIIITEARAKVNSRSVSEAVRMFKVKKKSLATLLSSKSQLF